jgi:hypothetical protein
VNAERHRGTWFVLSIAFAGLMLLCGWLVPAHLRAVDAAVLRRAGQGTPSLMDRAAILARENNPGAARLIARAAQDAQVPGAAQLKPATGAPSKNLFPGGPEVISPAPEPLAPLVIRLENRDRVLAFLAASTSPGVRELLRCRELTNTVLFPPSSSSSGQAFDAAVSVCGLLMARNDLSPGLRDAIAQRAGVARTSASAQPLEEILMNLMSLGQRFAWGQLAAFVSGIGDPQSLSILADQARNAGAQLPALFAAVELSQKPDQVAAYLGNFSQSGLNDLAAALRFGQGGVDELLRRNQHLYSSPLRQRWTASGPLGLFFRAACGSALRAPWFALTVKWFFYISGGFLLAVAMHFARPAMKGIEEPLRVRGFAVARELLFALGFLLVVLLLSEPFLAQEAQRTEYTFRLRLPSVGAAAATSTAPGVKPKLMDTRSLFTLFLFFVLQALIYCACLVKLAEIRRQKVVPRLQLRLLENEEHLFDAGLYLGFAGTIVSLILVSLGIIQQSLMAAYSSTSFGIIFVSIFKIFNLRPARRQMLLLAEAETRPTETAVSDRTSVATAS